MDTSLSLARRALLASGLLLASRLAAQPSAEVDAHEIVLGQTASFSGSFASQAAAYRDGAQACFAAVNARGGVHGRSIRMVSLDDAYTVERATANARALIDEHRVFALFNCTWTNTVKAVIALAEQAGVPMLSPYTGYEELYAQPSPWVFTTRASFSQELARIILHLRTIGHTRVGLLHYDSASGRELLTETQQRLQRAGFALQGVGTMQAGSRQAAQAVAALGQAHIEALVIGASGSDAVAFIRAFEAVRRGRTQYYARSLIGSRQLVDELGPLSVGISISQTAPNPHKNRAPVAVEYRRSLAQLDPGLKPDYIGLEGMISAKVLVEALHRAGPQPTRRGLVEAIESMRAFDAGGYALAFGPAQHHGSQYVDITFLGERGRVLD